MAKCCFMLLLAVDVHPSARGPDSSWTPGVRIMGISHIHVPVTVPITITITTNYGTALYLYYP
jgi:hypothetical protein